MNQLRIVQSRARKQATKSRHLTQRRKDAKMQSCEPAAEPREAFGVRRIPPLSKAREYRALQTLRDLTGVRPIHIQVFSSFQ